MAHDKAGNDTFNQKRGEEGQLQTSGVGCGGSSILHRHRFPTATEGGRRVGEARGADAVCNFPT